MRLSKTAYHADFAIYAIILGVLFASAAVSTNWVQRIHWFAAFTAATAGWTLLEYLLHRFLLHRVSIFSAMHAVHHDSPRAYVGTPTWATLGIIGLVVFLPAWRGVSFNVANGLTAGVMLGFFWYGVVHHVIHYRRPRLLAAWMPAATHRHLRHHYSTRPGNFGVTIPLWDYVFGTAIGEDRVRPRAASLGDPALARLPERLL
jgi:sterol desaturase/sphingolipid hydroxylase (fatty acid hydroxylase superfamily)